MTAQIIERLSIGKIESGINSNTLDTQTVAFVFRKLSEWRDDPDRPAEQSEDKLNLQLCKFLDSRARNDFPMVRFDHEEYQAGRRRVDLSASPVKATVIKAQLHTIYNPFLVLEGKRLPAPTKNRVKEYVTGGRTKKSGGIQRFKLGLHGAEVDMALMIGYIQKYDSHHWHASINQWILELADGLLTDNCVWNADETLSLIEDDAIKGVTALLSVHGRTNSISGKEITLRHLWIVMNMGE